MKCGDVADSSAWCQHQILSAVRKGVSHEGLLPVHSSECLWQCPDAYSAVEGLSVHWLTKAHVLHPFHESQSHHTRAKVSHCQNGRVTTVRQGRRFSR